MLRVLDPNGRLVGDDPGLTIDDLHTIYRLMARARAFDRKALSLQRQGRIGTYPPLEGQEGAQIGSALALRPDDWIYPSYREHGVQLARGMPMDVVLGYWKGVPNPAWAPDRWRMGLTTVPIASQIPHAVGHAYQERLAGRSTVVMTYCGDGATSEGDFHAGLNFAGVWKTPNVFFCQNNSYAISVPFAQQTAASSIAVKAKAYGFEGVQVDGMDPLAVWVATTTAVESARRGDGPTLIEAITYRYGPHATADDPTLYRDVTEVEAWRALDPLDRLRRHLELRQAPIDVTSVADEAADEAEEAIRALEDRPLPDRADAVRHTYTRIPSLLADQLYAAQRGRGEPEGGLEDHEIAEPERDSLPDGSRRPMNMAEALTAALTEAMERHPETVVLGEDVGRVGGVFRITEGLQDAFGPDRVIDTPLNESGIVGTALGMAMAGGRPIAEIQFDGFVYPAFDQIVSHLGRMRYRGRGTVDVPVVVRMPSGAGIRAHEHHSDSPEAFFAHAPGLIVIVPSTPVDAKGLLAAAVESNDPVIFLEPKVLYRAGRSDVPIDHFTLPIGRARIRRPGDDATIVTYGGMVPKAITAAESIDASVEVIDLRTVFPWDRETVLASVARTGRLLLVQEPPRTAGIAAEIAATVAEELLYALEAPIVRVCGFDAPMPHFAVEEHGLIDTTQIETALRSLLTD